jgi:polyphosphate kinase
MILTKQALLDRDSSILSFNERVLSLSLRQDYPILERLKFLCIVASNLDEFFEVRMDAQLDAMRDHLKMGTVTEHTFAAVSEQAHALVKQQYAIFNDVLMPALRAEGIDIVAGVSRNEHQKKWVLNYFNNNVKPLLLPIALDLAHPFPLVASKALHFIVELASEKSINQKPNNQHLAGQASINIIRVPRTLPRLLKLPKNGTSAEEFVLLTSIIAAHLPSLFVGKKIISFSQFRVTRHSDLALDEDDISDLPSALRQELAQRPFGEAVRLEVSEACSDQLADFLLAEFKLPQPSLYRVSGPVNLGRLIQLSSLADETRLAFPAFKPSWPKTLTQSVSIFNQLKTRDILIHRPYESFDAVIAFLREAVYDPDVLAIHQTIYRTGSDTRMLSLLQEAVRRGKEVLVVVEIQARFDEETNINWAESLETIGAQIVYGMLGLKTHAKMLLVMRKEGGRIKRYAHVSTGNYNANTSKLYTDICMLTSNMALTRELEYVFRHLTSQIALPRMSQLLVAPFNLQGTMLRHIAVAKRAAMMGDKAHIVAKMNSLTDEILVRALIEAAKHGVEIDLIVRGACILPIDAHGVDGRIRVRSIVGRFLEHSRIFYFEITKKDAEQMVVSQSKKMWLSSADWMSRNMLRRIEIAWPIKDEEMQQRIMQECLMPYLADTADAWVQIPNGEYERINQQNSTSKRSATTQSAQQQLIARFSASVN